MVQTYMLAGFIDLGFSLSIQSLSTFHFFYGLLGVGGVGLLYLSVKVAEEKNLNFGKERYIMDCSLSLMAHYM